MKAAILWKGAGAIKSDLRSGLRTGVGGAARGARSPGRGRVIKVMPAAALSTIGHLRLRPDAGAAIMPAFKRN